MEWETIKASIIDDLNSRGLKDPSVRIRALERIEALMQEHYPQYIADCVQLKQIGKTIFKKQLAEVKGRNLNSAESSVVNEIYYILDPREPNCPTTPRVRYQVHICPYCYTPLTITEDLWECDFIHCSQCANDFANPIKEEQKLEQAAKGMLVAGMMNDIVKIILYLGLLVFIIWAIWGCTSNRSTTHTYDAENTTMQQNDSEFIGVWMDDFNKNIRWRIRKITEKEYILQMGMADSDEYIDTDRLILKTKSGGKPLFLTNEYGAEEFYQMDSNGNLMVFDHSGYIGTYRKCNL